jgi:hypothetical protein
MKLFTKLWDGLKKLPGLIFPMFAGSRDLRNVSPRLRWSLHFIFMATALVGLTFLNPLFEGIIRAPSSVRRVWLPLFFLLVYILCWLGWWILQHIGMEPEGSEFPDIDDAWEEAIQALEGAGLGLTEAPLFLVLGQPEGDGQDLFDAAQDPKFELLVKAAPSRRDAPLRVYATRQGIYVTCAGASVLAREAAILAGEAEATEPADSSQPSAPAFGQHTWIGMEDETLVRVQEIFAFARSQGRSFSQLLPEERAEIERLTREAERRTDQPRPKLHKNTSEVERLTARLRHLCRLIVRDRRPFCPVNGLLFLIPVTATDNAEDADEAARSCKDDLATASEVLQVRCPVIALVCGLDQLSGFRNFIEPLPEETRRRRFGRSFPLLPDIKPESLPEVLESGVRWMGNTLFPAQIYRLLRIETPQHPERSEVVQENVQLFLLLSEIRERQKHLGQILVRGFAQGPRGPAMFGGCYLAGTGHDPIREQAFITDVLLRLLEEQEYVSWTPEVFAEEAALNRLTNIGYVVLGILATLGVLGLGYSMFAAKWS